MGKKKKQESEEEVEVRDVNLDEAADDEAIDESEETPNTDEANGSDSATEPKEENVEELKEKITELENKRIRVVAEFDNYKRRTAKEFMQKSEAGKISVFNDMLEVIDAFDTALHQSKESTDMESFKKGLELIFDKFKTVFDRNGVEIIDPIGEDFDPELHEAMMHAPHDDYEEGKISQVYQKGYKLGDTMVRHAKVIVSKGIE